ncbi:MAG: hypothetical protein A4E53_02527 [Pelotomaculum sp. PtaB.Bin104]|nr:MAG: hypothetical protein A4E53_02527 [Pelotomaculum sp. PtaB.Bin104]
MKRTSLILNIIIGLAGFVGAIIALLVGVFGVGADNTNEAVAKCFAAIPLALLGIVVGTWAIADPEGSDHTNS